MYESIFGEYAPKFISGVNEVELDYWYTITDGPTEDSVIIHESKLTAKRSFISRPAQWEFIGTVNLFKYANPRTKFDELYTYHNKVVTLYKHRDGSAFSYGGTAIQFRLEVIPKNLRTLDYRDVVVLRFTSLYGFDYRSGMIILDQNNIAILDESGKAIYGGLI
jgi:hypothetical protein